MYSTNLFFDGWMGLQLEDKTMDNTDLTTTSD